MTKDGSVVRLSKQVMEFLNRQRKSREPMDRLLRRLLGIPNRKGICESQVFWTLPGELYHSKSEAKGAAILRKQKTSEGNYPTPVPVIVRQ